MLKLDYEKLWKLINNDGRLMLAPLLTHIATETVKRIKGDKVDLSHAQVNWVEFKGFRQLLTQEKDQLEE